MASFRETLERLMKDSTTVEVLHNRQSFGLGHVSRVAQHLFSWESHAGFVVMVPMANLASVKQNGAITQLTIS